MSNIEIKQKNCLTRIQKCIEIYDLRTNFQNIELKQGNTVDDVLNKFINDIDRLIENKSSRDYIFTFVIPLLSNNSALFKDFISKLKTAFESSKEERDQMIENTIDFLTHLEETIKIIKHVIQSNTQRCNEDLRAFGAYATLFCP